MPFRSQEHATHGAVMLDSHTTRFALWAPDARQVEVECENAAPQPMQRSDDGWFVLRLPCPAGTRYRYRIDGDLSVADPASRAQPDGVHGPSQVLGTEYAWQHPDWQGRPWHEAVIYEVHVGLLGGYAGVARHLPRLAALGVTAIELMPIGQFPGQRNWGYDGVLPFAPQASYGTAQQLKALIDQAHALGLMVLLDVVYNHFGPDGNYLHRYAQGFFREDRHTPWGAAIDFRRRQVRDFFIENALMWLHDYRFDGLRLDAVHAIDDPDFLHELARRVRASTAPGRQVWLTLENERNQAHLLQEGYDAQWNDDGHNALHVLLTGEQEGYYVDYREAPLNKLARCLSQGFVFQGQPDRNGEPRGEASGHLPPSAFVLFLQNHDQIGNRALGERLERLCPPQALRAATGLLLLAPMIPLLFMGDDWGCRQPFLFFTDHHDDLATAVREGRRAEFKGFKAFADPEQRARIPDPNAAQTFLDSQPQWGEDSEQWVALYRRLLYLRHQHIIPRLPGTRALGAQVVDGQGVSARWQLGDGSELRIDLNLGQQPLALDLPARERHLFESCELPPGPHCLPPLSCVVSLTPSCPTEPVHA